MTLSLLGGGSHCMENLIIKQSHAQYDFTREPHPQNCKTVNRSY